MRNKEKEIREPGESMASEKRLLKFAKSYLSEAFPNPERAGCPPESALERLASRPREADASVSEHLTCCSPCFNRYIDLLAEVEQERETSFKKTFAWAIASPLRAAAVVGLALGIVIGMYILVGRVETPPPVPPEVAKPPEPVGLEPTPPTYVQFVLDLSRLSPVRGEEVGPTPETAARIPQSTLDLTLHLPLGSEEGTYRLSVRAKDKILWEASAEARLRDQKMTLQVKADLSKIPPGRYILEVESPGAVSLKQSVSLGEGGHSKP